MYLTPLPFLVQIYPECRVRVLGNNQIQKIRNLLKFHESSIYSISVTLTADVVFVNGIAFLIIFWQKFKLLTVEHVPNRSIGQRAKSTMKIIKLYTKGGFQVKVVFMDREFDKNKDNVGHLEVKTTDVREDATGIERQIRLVK